MQTLLFPPVTGYELQTYYVTEIIHLSLPYYTARFSYVLQCLRMLKKIKGISPQEEENIHSLP